MTGLDSGGVAGISLFSLDGGHTSGTKNPFHVTSSALHDFISCPHVVSSPASCSRFNINSPNSLLLGLFHSLLRCVRPFCSFVSQVISLLLSPRFGACTAGVRPFLLTIQHFHSFVPHVTSLLWCLYCWCPPFSAGHAAFLFICPPCDFFTLVPVLLCWCPPFSAGHAAFLFICPPCDFFTLVPVLPVSALFRWPCIISIHLSPM